MQNSDSGLVVVFMRHGDYNPSSGEITPRGEENVHSMAEKLQKNYNIHPSIIATSPKLRVVQSAKVAATVFGPDLVTKDPVQIEELDDKYGLGEFANRLKKMPDGGALICMTHDTTIMGNIMGLMPPEKKMEALLNPPRVQFGDAVIVRIAGQQWAEVGEKPATYELVLH